MSDSETDSNIEDDYHNLEEFEDFIEFSDEERPIVIDEKQLSEINSHKNNPTVINVDDEEEEEEPEEDKIRTLTTTLKPNETQAQKLLKAHISVLISALGGIDYASDIKPSPYKLGHDALACLKDIKRWIKAVDEKQNNYEVALACAECGLIQNDLIIILSQWESKMQKKRPIKNKMSMEKIMLSCLEILVLLTWPIEFSNNLSDNQKLLYTNIKKNHVIYKKHILNYNDGQTLKAIIRLVLPVIAKSKIDREPRDNQILRLVLYLIRNLLAIEPPTSSVSSKSSHKSMVATADLPAGVTQDDISINKILRIFKKNKVLMLLLTISGSIGTEFDKDLFGEICLECIYLMVKGLNSKDVLQKPPQDENIVSASAPIAPISTTVGLQLSDMLATEAKKKQAHTSNIATRHGKFGTLLSIRSSDSNSYVVSGEEALIGTDGTMDKLDKSKTWQNKSHFKYDSDDFIKTTTPVYLNNEGRILLNKFIEEFLLEGCFNNLIEIMASKLTSQSEYSQTDELSNASYFFTISWFLNYQREHINLNGSKNYDFGSVRAALSEINFILIVSYFRDSFTNKLWNSLHVAMICFKELLQISNSIFGKQKLQQNEYDDDNEVIIQHEIDRELAEGIIRKLFSFNDFLNILVQIPQIAFKHSPKFLGESIKVITIILKSFESFAKEDLQLYVQTKRRQKRQNKSRINDLDRDNENKLSNAIYESDEELVKENIKEVTRERKLNFAKTEIRFFNQSIVTSYIEYLSRYQDLTHEDIKICISYFHKLFVIKKDYNGLFRLDFLQLLSKLKNHLPRGSSIRNKIEEFIYYFMKKFKIALTRFPNIIEILFPRIEESSTKCYLSTGELYELDYLNDKYKIKDKNGDYVRLNGFGNDDEEYRGNDDDDDDSENEIAFEIAANPNSNNKNGTELDELDEIEQQLELHNKSDRPRRNIEPGKAQKRKSKTIPKTNNKTKTKAKAPSTQIRRRKVPKDLIEDDDNNSSNHQIKSSEFINESDDNSDDEEFFQREEILRNLLNSNQNISNDLKLKEIKKMWDNLAKNSGNNLNVSKVIDKVVEEVSLFVPEDEDDEEYDYDKNKDKDEEVTKSDDEVSQDEIDTTKNDIDNYDNSEKDKESDNNSVDSDLEDKELSQNSSNTSAIESDTILKRSRITDEDEDEKIPQQRDLPSRKRRAIILDDEDE
ncbi:TOF1 [Candida pseudojiufengensis]|uniref:TOF1 n=1 Tax=Candida pseudojiufengensis TaxID=497109 RepID=UPI0022254DEF|nr:TOF1 [Candida pseudojiufengensis]KAI5964307.1 TOF1 [Candida pseudojiufengensis]